MKKIIVCFMLSLSLVLLGCGSDLKDSQPISSTPNPERIENSQIPDEEATFTESPTPETETMPETAPALETVTATVGSIDSVLDFDVPENFDLSIFKEEVETCIEVLNECHQEMFTAILENDVPAYKAAYLSEEDFYSGVVEPEMIIPFNDELDAYRDKYYIDEMQVEYYLVSNYQTIQQLEDYILQFMSSDVLEETQIDGAFFEYENNIYLTRGSRGYGAISLDIDSLKFIKYENERYYLRIDQLLRDEPYGYMDLTFEYIDEKLIIVEAQGNSVM